MTNYIYTSPSYTYSGTTADISASWVDSTTVVASTTARSTEVEIKANKKDISPKLYFSFVKSKLETIKVRKLEARLSKMRAMIEQCKLTGQKGLMEELAKLIAIAAREQEAYVCGIKQFVDRKTIDRFKDQVSIKIKFKPLDEFPRMIPTKIVEQIKNVKEARLFDEYYVLYTDLTGEETLSTEKKIQAKDPILFGRYSYAPDRWYLICDWIDDHCDLTIAKFVDQVGIFVEDIPEVDDEYLEGMKKHVMESHTRLKNTNPSNYKSMMSKAKDAFRRFFKK